MRIKRTTPHRTLARHVRLIAATSGLVAATAFAIPASASAQPVPQTFSAAELAAASDSVLSASPGGIAWYTDKKTDTVVVTADSTVSKAEIAKIKEAAGDKSGAIEINRTPGTMSKLIQGGDAIYTGGGRCSLGFNVASGGTSYFITAGHCTNIGSTWYSNSAQTTLIGPTAGSSFPTNDYGIVRYDGSVSHPGTAGGVDITSAGNASVGMSVTRHGSTTGTHSGSVTGTNATVDYGGGDVVFGMIQTNVCAEPGDSGGSLRSGSTAIGLTSGGSGNCSSGGTTFFQPVPEVLSAYGVSIT